jgi:glycosyltransferase involved in cell wall biosynthesis
MPAISVVIPVFNRADSVGRAISSVLAQVLPMKWTMKIIVVDDGSTDHLLPAIQAFMSQVTLLRHERNLGAAAARNTGIAAAHGDFVAFLDSDDTWLDGKLNRQLEIMQKYNWQASCTAYKLARPGRKEFVSPRYRTGALRLSDIVWGCYVSPGSTLVVRKSVFNEIGPLDVLLKRQEDWDWLLRYARQYPLGFIGEPLARVEPSFQRQFKESLAAIDVISAKNLDTLKSIDRRHFLAGADVSRAAAYYRARKFAAAIRALARSLLRAPVGNTALFAVLHNSWPRA